MSHEVLYLGKNFIRKKKKKKKKPDNKGDFFFIDRLRVSRKLDQCECTGV